MLGREKPGPTAPFPLDLSHRSCHAAIAVPETKGKTAAEVLTFYSKGYGRGGADEDDGEGEVYA